MTKPLLQQIQISLTTASVSQLTYSPPPAMNNIAVVLDIYNHCKVLSVTRVNRMTLHYITFL